MARSSFFARLTATSRAFTRDRGATNESPKEAMSLRAFRVYLQMGASGDASLSVMANTSAPRSRANCMIFTVRLE